MGNYIKLGSVSKNPFNEEELVESFAAELKWLAAKDQNDKYRRSKAIDFYIKCQSMSLRTLKKEVHNLLAEGLALLQSYAPPLVVFGANPTENNNFGFWPDLEALEASDVLAVPKGAVWPAFEDEGVRYIMEVAESGETLLYQASSKQPVWGYAD